MESNEMQQIIDKLQDLERTHKDAHTKLSSELESIKEQLKPVVKLYDTALGFTTTTKWIFGFLIAIAGAYILVKSIIRPI